MKKLILLFIIFVSLPVEAQFALKGGVSYSEKEISNYVVTGQFYKDLLVLSGDVIIPTDKNEKIAGAGRIGIGFGGDRIRLAADVGARYEHDDWRFGYGAEINLRLLGPVGMFARWSRTHPISKKEDHNNVTHHEVLWKCERSEITIGIVIDLINGGCY